MAKLERRLIQQEFRVSPDSEIPQIEGYAAVFDVAQEILPGWTEAIDKHAFDNVIAANPDCRALFNHDANHVLGRTTSGTLKLNIDARGLAYVVDPPDTQFAKDLMVSIRRGDITGSSFGFVTKRDQWTDNPDGSVSRVILEIGELLDVSPVTYPAYTTATSGVRSLPESMPKEIRSRFEAREDGADDADPNENGCQCECPECVDNECNDCSDPLCTDENCLANRAWKQKAEMRITLAKLGKV